MPALAHVPNSLIKAQMATYEEAYNRFSADFDMISKFMATIPSVHFSREEVMHYYEATAGWERRDPDTDRDSFSTFGDVSWTIEVLEWLAMVAWRRIDEEDAQTPMSVRNQAERVALKQVLVDIEIFFQMMLGSTNFKRLKTIPNAPDGNSIFTTNTRNGDTGGNTTTGTGTTLDKILDDYDTTKARWLAIQDQAGDKLLDDGAFDRGVTIFAGHHLRRPMLQAFRAEIIQGTAAAIQNVNIPKVAQGVKSDGEPITLVFTSRIPTTNDDWFLFLNDPTLPAPTFRLMRNDVNPGGMTEMIYVNELNSDDCRKGGFRGYDMRFRRGYGKGPIQSCWKVNNA